MKTSKRYAAALVTCCVSLAAALLSVRPLQVSATVACPEYVLCGEKCRGSSEWVLEGTVTAISDRDDTRIGPACTSKWQVIRLNEVVVVGGSLRRGFSGGVAEVMTRTLFPNSDIGRRIKGYGSGSLLESSDRLN